MKLLNKTYVVVDREHVKELVDAPETEISFHHINEENLQLHYTFGKSLSRDYNHAHLIRTKLTRKIADLIPDIVDELGEAFGKEFKVRDGN
jgi:hypothetical protein